MNLTEAVPVPLQANVLIVDDVPENLLAMRAILEGDGLSVLTAGSGAEALELLLAQPVAVALLDVNMPEMSGFDLAELMRGSTRTREVPILFLTASPRDPHRMFRGYDSGAVDFLYKPVEPHVILSKVRVFVEMARQRELMRQNNERLARALALNETMIAVMSHDLRTPLSVISLCAESLELMPPEADRGRIAGRILDSAHRMARMIAQLLDFSKIRSGVLRLEPQDGDLRAVADEVAEEFRQSAPGVAVELACEGALGGRFDRDRMTQVLSNLVGNAVRHADDARVSVRLDGGDAERLRAQVRNRGRIDDALLPRLFEPFKSGFQTCSGLGLGLYIVDQFVRAHGGEVGAANVDGEVVFTLWIPRRPSATAADGACAQAAPLMLD